MDQIYLTCDEENIIFLDCTRLDGSKKLVSRNNPDDTNNVSNQVFEISKKLLRLGKNKIFLVDDVVFSGSVLRTISLLFKSNGIDVVGIKSAITTKSSYDYFNDNLLYGLSAGYLMDDDVIDQICERDFYFGIAQSGISTMKNGSVYKSPYFKPFGNPVERASIPNDYEKMFSNGCIDRSIALWEKIDELSGKTIMISDLPEKIDLTESNDSVVKTLKRGRI